MTRNLATTSHAPVSDAAASESKSEPAKARSTPRHRLNCCRPVSSAPVESKICRSAPPSRSGSPSSAECRRSAVPRRRRRWGTPGGASPQGGYGQRSQRRFGRGHDGFGGADESRRVIDQRRSGRLGILSRFLERTPVRSGGDLGLEEAGAVGYMVPASSRSTGAGSRPATGCVSSLGPRPGLGPAFVAGIGPSPPSRTRRASGDDHAPIAAPATITHVRCQPGLRCPWLHLGHCGAITITNRIPGSHQDHAARSGAAHVSAAGLQVEDRPGQ